MANIETWIQKRKRFMSVAVLLWLQVADLGLGDAVSFWQTLIVLSFDAASWLAA